MRRQQRSVKHSQLVFVLPVCSIRSFRSVLIHNHLLWREIKVSFRHKNTHSTVFELKQSGSAARLRLSVVRFAKTIKMSEKYFQPRPSADEEKKLTAESSTLTHLFPLSLHYVCVLRHFSSMEHAVVARQMMNDQAEHKSRWFMTGRDDLQERKKNMQNKEVDKLQQKHT